ncbi:hypothetical protein N566_08925 [Streptomycetaceae bacterium MP113-05]|nr:hypothetical protein N566_08925 [Streptomycetaceae bacterium MP113-05]
MRAAFTFRPRVVPQFSHVQVRTLSGVLLRRAPQAEHGLEEGNHLSTAITSRPYQSALYSGMLRNSLQAASERASSSRQSASPRSGCR